MSVWHLRISLEKTNILTTLGNLTCDHSIPFRACFPLFRSFLSSTHQCFVVFTVHRSFTHLLSILSWYIIFLILLQMILLHFNFQYFFFQDTHYIFNAFTETLFLAFYLAFRFLKILRVADRLLCRNQTAVLLPFHAFYFLFLTWRTR